MATHQRTPGQDVATLATALRWARVVVAAVAWLILVAVLAGPALGALFGPSRPMHARPSSRIALDIMPTMALGPAQNYPAYLPSTTLTVPAHSQISVTIRNFDLDATTVAQASPNTHVEGTVGGVAYADGMPYAGLDPSAMAHTFTVPALHLNVPIPGRSASGKRYVVVTFSFRSGAPGAYVWHCAAPCGDGPDGLEGRMADVGFMRGVLTVES
jgi:hypothetical protein